MLGTGVVAPTSALAASTNDQTVETKVRQSVLSHGGLVRTAPLVRVKAKFTVKIAVCKSLRRRHTAFFDWEFGFDELEWSCSR